MPEHVFFGAAEPSLEDFAQSDWQTVLAQLAARTCRAYSEAFWSRCDEARAANADSAEYRVYALLTYLCALIMPHDSTNPMLIDSQGGNVQLNATQMATLSELLPSIQDAEMRARIADVLWGLKYGKYYHYAQVAVEAYLQSASALEDPVKWSDSELRIARALHIAILMGKKNGLFDRVVDHIEGTIAKLDGQDPLFYSVRLHGHLFGTGQGDAAKYAALAIQSADASHKTGVEINWQRAREFWEIAAKWHKRDGDEDASRDALVNAAETYVKEADSLPLTTPMRSTSTAWLITRAIEAYRRIQGTDERRHELHRLLLTYQRSAVADLATLKGPSFDLSEVANQAIALVEGKTLYDALRALALSIASPSVNELRALIEKQSQDQGLFYVIPATLLDSQGRTAAVRPAISDDREESVRAEMLRQAAQWRDMTVHAFILPAIRQINNEHHFSEVDFRPFVLNNPFISQGREHIFARALCAGLRGDLIVSTHLLLPQIENSLRYLLQNRGHITSGLDDNRIQEEFTLNKLLDNFGAQLAAVLGEDLFFDLRGLLTERFGSNLRNLALHGLLGEDDLHSTQALYLWWLVLHLCYAAIGPPDEEPDPLPSTS